MVKFLHTADLHLGKVFHEYSLVEDQKYLLDQLTDLLTDSSYSALLVAGDIYDRSIPSPEAVSLFGSFLGKLRAARPSLAVLLLPGNHDSPSRLGFGRELFAELGIHIAGDPQLSAEPVMVTQDGEGCAFFLLPFLNPGSFALSSQDPSGEPLRSQRRLAEEAALRLEAGRRKVLDSGPVRTVLAAHLFTLGGMESASERIFLGAAEQVDAGLFSGFDYLALGHLHRCQQVGANGWYSGSPLAYSFDEAGQEKVFLSVELERDSGPRINPIPVRPLRPLRRLRGPFSLFFSGAAAASPAGPAAEKVSPEDPPAGQAFPGVPSAEALREAAGEYLEIALTDPRLVENPLALLRSRFHWLLSIKQDEAFAALSRREAPPEGGPGEKGGERRSPVDDFGDFLIELYGGADAEKLALFQELLREADREELPPCPEGAAP
jgi:exonuclease SbcD